MPEIVRLHQIDVKMIPWWQCYGSIPDDTSSLHRHSRHIEIRPGVPAGGPAGLFDLRAEDDGVVEGDVVGPDELGAFEVVLEVGLFGIDFFDGVFFGVLPGAVVEVDGSPVGGKRFLDDFGIGGVAVHGAVEEVFGLPARVGDGAVGEFDAEAGVADAGAVFHAGFRVGVVFGEDGDGHRILGEKIDANDVVWRELDGVHGDEAAIHVEHEPVVGIDVEFDRVGDAGLHEAGRAAFGFAAAFFGFCGGGWRCLCR